ncbi:MAG: hypothetical protein JWN38_537 [Candidatus Saccharibacteria bacterium]|nr:hypothetical protein [Candidatus Saccharibacteria bacterium]
MNLLLLGGNSLRNQAWIHQVSDSLAGDFATRTVIDYRHWQTGEPNLDFAHELSQIATAATTLGEYAVFAKSAGSILALEAIQQGILRPNRAVFTGLALPMVGEHPAALEALRTATIPITILQNDSDPVASYAEVAAALRDNNITSVELVSLPGDSHDYDDLGVIRSALI